LQVSAEKVLISVWRLAQHAERRLLQPGEIGKAFAGRAILVQPSLVSGADVNRRMNDLLVGRHDESS
jgi:hypothetical protein